MSKAIVSADVRGQMIFLGTGTSIGVPVIGCDCPTCTSTNPRNNRLRCALVLGLPEGNLLIDTPPDLREQFYRYKPCHATCTLGCARSASQLDNWRSQSGFSS